MRRALRPLALALALIVPTTGCIGLAPGARGHYERRDSHVVWVADRGEQGALELGDDGPAPGGLELTHNDAGRVGLIVIAVLVFPIVILIDLVSLPFTGPSGHPFACTRFVIDACFRH